MRKWFSVFVIAAALAILASPAAAQGRVPATDMWGAGFSVGGGFPVDERLDSGIGLTGNLERYVTPRVSVRGQGHAGWFDIEGIPGATLKPVYFDGNLVYNWEHNAWHPYVTGGLGVYHFRADFGSADESDTSLGANLGAGIEYFFTPNSALTGEGLYHALGDIETPLISFDEGGFWTLGMGFKHYF